MTAHHLPRDGDGDIIKGEGAGFLRDARMKDDLEKQVAEFVTEVVHVTTLDGVDDLVRLLDGVGRDGRVSLLEIPRAPRLRCSKGGDDRDQRRTGALMASGGLPADSARSSA